MRRKFKFELVNRWKFNLGIAALIVVVYCAGYFAPILTIVGSLLLAFFLYFSYESLISKDIVNIELTKYGIKFSNEQPLIKWGEINWWRIDQAGFLGNELALDVEDVFFPVKIVGAKKDNCNSS